MRRKDQPRRPKAIICCRLSSLNTLLMPLQASLPRSAVNVPRDYFSMAGFEVTIYGRFWVTPEVSKQTLSRSLRIMDALLKAVEARGHQIEQKDLRFVVNGEQMRFYINEKVKRTERKLTPAEKEHYWGIDKWVF